MPDSAVTALQFDSVEKRYGPLVALRPLTLAVARGECVLLLGANGSGKTTLLKLSALLLRPTRGRVTSPRHAGDGPVALKASLGYVAHATLLYDELTAEENLTFFARLFGIADASARVSELLESCGLAARRAGIVRTFSRGMRQRLALARALLNRPSLLLLDEPTTGLDRQGHLWLAGRLAMLKDEGCTILMSAHGASEAAALATRAVLLDRGALLADSAQGGSVAQVQARANELDGLSARGPA